MDVTSWREQEEQSAPTADSPAAEPISTGNSELEDFRRRLEGLL
jgi:hypothetical protein